MMKRTLVVLAALLVGGAALAQDRAPGDPIPGVSVKLGRKPPGGGTIVAEGKTDAGFTVTRSHLDVVANVPGATQAAFDQAAANAKAGCPISRLLNAETAMTATPEA